MVGSKLVEFVPFVKAYPVLGVMVQRYRGGSQEVPVVLLFTGLTTGVEFRQMDGGTVKLATGCTSVMHSVLVMVAGGPGQALLTASVIV